MARYFTDGCSSCGKVFQSTTIAKVENITANHEQRCSPSGSSSTQSLDDAMRAAKDEFGSL